MPDEPPVPATAPRASAGEIYRAYNDTENRHDLEGLAVFLSEHLKVTVNGRPALASADEDRAAMAELLRQYPDFRRELDEVIPAAENRVVVRWRMIGTSADEQVAALDVAGCSIVTIADGRLDQAYLYYDGKPLDDALRSVSPS